MKKLITVSVFYAISWNIAAQQILEIPENNSVQHNNLDYGYLITNEKNKAVKGEDYDRFEIELYVQNKSSCIKLMPLKTNALGQIMEDGNYAVATFTIKNATGKRLTAKTGIIEAQPWYANVKITGNNTVTTNGLTQALIGYAIKTGQSFSKKIIVIVPKGERPIVQCKTVYIPDIF